jgi:hypothetical protein
VRRSFLIQFALTLSPSLIEDRKWKCNKFALLLVSAFGRDAISERKHFLDFFDRLFALESGTSGSAIFVLYPLLSSFSLTTVDLEMIKSFAGLVCSLDTGRPPAPYLFLSSSAPHPSADLTLDLHSNSCVLYGSFSSFAL